MQTLIEQLKHLRQREAQWSKDEAVAVVGRDKGSVTEFLNLRGDKGSVKEFFNLSLKLSFKGWTETLHTHLKGKIGALEKITQLIY